MKRFLNLFLISIIVLMSLTVVGCSSKEEQPAEQPTAEVTEQDLNRVKFAATIAEEKITTIFEEFTPADSETVYLVGKPRYTTVDEVKAYLSAYYTDNMVNSIVENYVKVEEVPEKGSITTLLLPEYYVSISGYEFTEQDTVTIENDKATISFTVDSKKVTYTLVQVEGNWKVDTKTVE